MNIESISKKISDKSRSGQILCNVPMKEHTSFKIGGTADLMVLPKSAEEIIAVMELCRVEGIPYLVMGYGSNLLVKDGGIRGVVIKLHKGFSAVRMEGRLLRVQSGASLAAVARLSARHGLAGLAFAAGIPGSMGGGVVMNAGAYGGEMKDVIKRVLVYNQGAAAWSTNAEAGFEYRSSSIKKEKKIVLETELEMEYGNESEIVAQIECLMQRRSEKQPLEYPSAGSTFKRPQTGYAAELIDKSGCKGMCAGGAMVSEKHAGFIINTGAATAADVLQLMDLVEKRVYDTFGVSLQREVEIVGE
ncbi:MAG: UDP-N-acetylmuramate dehydrogenase [Christensenellales bacterium]